MDYRKIGNKIVLRLLKGDKVIKSLEDLAAKENISGAQFVGIGAVNELKLGILHPGDDDYKWDTYNEDLEITSLLGNITSFNDKPLIHCHITCGREDSSVIGGHLGEATVSFTAEIFIDLLDEALIKKENTELGINTIEFE